VLDIKAFLDGRLAGPVSSNNSRPISSGSRLSSRVCNEGGSAAAGAARLCSDAGTPDIRGVSCDVPVAWVNLEGLLKQLSTKPGVHAVHVSSRHKQNPAPPQPRWG
jgi:hypothetical protein